MCAEMRFAERDDLLNVAKSQAKLRSNRFVSESKIDREKGSGKRIRRAHNPKVAGSNPAPATKRYARMCRPDVPVSPGSSAH